MFLTVHTARPPLQGFDYWGKWCWQDVYYQAICLQLLLRATSCQHWSWLCLEGWEVQQKQSGKTPYLGYCRYDCVLIIWFVPCPTSLILFFRHEMEEPDCVVHQHSKNWETEYGTDQHLYSLDVLISTDNSILIIILVYVAELFDTHSMHQLWSVLQQTGDICLGRLWQSLCNKQNKTFLKTENKYF